MTHHPSGNPGYRLQNYDIIHHSTLLWVAVLSRLYMGMNLTWGPFLRYNLIPANQSQNSLNIENSIGNY